MYFTCVCLCVCELECLCVYDFVTLQYVKVSLCVLSFGCEILYGRLCVGWIVVLITFNPATASSCLLMKKKKTQQQKKNVVSKYVTSRMVRSYTDRKTTALHLLFLGHLHKLYVYTVYILFHWDFSLPTVKLWPHLRLWLWLWAGSDKSYLLSYVDVYIELNSTGFLCQFVEKSKITNHADTLMYPTWHLLPIISLVKRVLHSDIYSSIYFSLTAEAERSSGATFPTTHNWHWQFFSISIYT